MLSPYFWSWFDEVAAPKLAHRTESFRKIFTYLDRIDRRVGIVETGCVRQPDNWAGDDKAPSCSTNTPSFIPVRRCFRSIAIRRRRHSVGPWSATGYASTPARASHT